MLLATDLDGTFLGGTSVHKQQLYKLISENAEYDLVFVTGRGLGSVKPLLNDPAIPNPAYIICDVGATIVHGDTLLPVDALQSPIELAWPGSLKIQETLAAVPGIIYQQVPQERRCSFFVKDDHTVQRVKEIMTSLDCDVIFSAGRFLDVLPKGVNKGSTLSKLIRLLNYSIDQVLVAGDTLNDLSMYQCGFKGVVVGLSEERLSQATATLKNVYHAKAAGAGGILEALHLMPS